MGGFSTDLSSLASKQYAPQKLLSRGEEQKVADKAFTDRGMLSDSDLAAVSSPTAEYFAALDEVKKKRKVLDSSIKDLEERLEKALIEKFDNAHNMLAEAFSGFKAGICQSVLVMKGADPAKIAAIQKKAYDTAKKNVRLGFERLATAYAEFEIYVS